MTLRQDGAWHVAAAELRFERDAGGAAKALVLHQDGQMLLAARESNTIDAPGAGVTASAASTASGNVNAAPVVK